MSKIYELTYDEILDAIAFYVATHKACYDGDFATGYKFSNGDDEFTCEVEFIQNG
jgi:hypothetical protein